MNRRDMVLMLLASANGQRFTPVQIQKAAYLVTRNAPEVIAEGPSFNFTPYDYGVFDAAVYGEANVLAAAEMAMVDNPLSKYRAYLATPEGIQRGNELLQNLDAPSRQYIQDISAWVRSLDFATLVKSMYEAYPETKVNSIFQG